MTEKYILYQLSPVIEPFFFIRRQNTKNETIVTSEQVVKIKLNLIFQKMNADDYFL